MAKEGLCCEVTLAKNSNGLKVHWRPKVHKPLPAPSGQTGQGMQVLRSRQAQCVWMPCTCSWTLIMSSGQASELYTP